MTQVEDLDWLVDAEGNLRPEAARALEEQASSHVTPRAPGGRELAPLGQWALRGLLVAAGVWAVVSLFEWVLLGLFALGLVARLRRWGVRGPEETRDAAGPQRRARVAVRGPADEVPLHGQGPVLHADPDPVLSMREE